MSDWRGVIKKRLDEYNERKQKITDALDSLLESLGNSPYGIYGKIVDIHEDNEIIWEVMISRKKVFISESEIRDNRIELVDENNNVKRLEYEDLKENLKDLILSKFVL